MSIDPNHYQLPPHPDKIKLMQPDNAPPIHTSQNQPSQYDFILKDKPKPKRKLIPSFTNLPKPARIIIEVVLALFVIIILLALFSGNHASGSNKLVSVVAQAQEIVRVDTIAAQQANNSSGAIQNLIATSSTVLSSQQAELTQYLKNNNVKISNNSLNADFNKNTDTSLQTATQNNNLDSVYLSYLKSQLNNYQTSLQTAYKSAGKNGKAILSKDYDSIQTLLNAPQFSS